MSIVGGVPGSAHTVVGTRELDGVSCAFGIACLAGGAARPFASSEGTVVTFIFGHPLATRPVVGTIGLIGVRCSPFGLSCLVVGMDSAHRGATVPTFLGLPGRVDAVPGTGELLDIAGTGAASVEVGANPALDQGVVVSGIR